MIKKIFKSVKETINPYYITLSYIIRIFVIVAIGFVSCDFISSPSTGKVFLGLCGLGVVVTYIIVFISNKIKNAVKQMEEGEKNDENDEVK